MIQQIRYINYIRILTEVRNVIGHGCRCCAFFTILPDKNIVSGTASKSIVTNSAIEMIGTTPTDQNVITNITVQIVITCTAIELIIPLITV